eukprot:6260809-Lingulodinium_polyedra.AAC.1
MQRVSSCMELWGATQIGVHGAAKSFKIHVPSTAPPPNSRPVEFSIYHMDITVLVGSWVEM